MQRSRWVQLQETAMPVTRDRERISKCLFMLFTECRGAPIQSVPEEFCMDFYAL